MQIKYRLLWIPCIAISINAYCQEPPNDFKSFIPADQSIGPTINVGQYIKERHDFPNKYKTVGVKNGVSKERAAIAALKFLKASHDSGNGLNRAYLEVE